MSSTYKSGRIGMLATLASPFHHGEGSIGNASILRRMRKFDARGRSYRLPFLSGNAFRHLIREAAVKYALDVMGYEAGPIPGRVVNLLYCGGNLTSTGNAVNVEQTRRIERLFPVVSLMGYSAGNHMERSKLRVDHLELVCREDVWAMPPELRTLPMAQVPIAEQIEEDFIKTRKDRAFDGTIMRLLPEGERLALEADIAERHEAKKKSRTKRAKSEASMQMISTTQVLCPGSQMRGGMDFCELTEMEFAALKSGLSYACKGVEEDENGPIYLYHLGAESTRGQGRVKIRFTGSFRSIQSPSHTPSTGLVRLGERTEADIAAYQAHLCTHAREILGALEEVA